MSDWQIARLSQDHDCSNFCCGHDSLDEWLKTRSGQFERRDLARTFVAVKGPSKVVLGYYSLVSHQVRFESIPDKQAKGLPKMEIPVALLGKLAVDVTAQRTGLGSFLLVDALRRAELVSRQIGIRAIEVDAIDESARNFYLKFGFISLRDDPNHLFLPISVIRQLHLNNP